MTVTNLTINEPKSSSIVEKQETKPVEQKKFDITEFMPSAGTLETTEKQNEILFSQVKSEDVNIRPDGLIYLPWMEYATRLSHAFGLKWALLPKGDPKIMNNLVVWGFYLIINGKYMSFAYGEQAYIPTNATMTYCDALEGAKSNALMRCCKSIGISLELWKPSFIEEWKSKHAETYQKPDKFGKMKTYWRKKGNINPDPEIIDVESEQPKTQPDNKLVDLDPGTPLVKDNEQPKTHQTSYSDIYTVTVKLIKPINGKNKSGKSYTVYKIIDTQDNEWSTFSKSIKEEIEKIALTNSSKVTLKAEKTRWGYNIIEIVKPTEEVGSSESEVIVDDEVPF